MALAAVSALAGCGGEPGASRCPPAASPPQELSPERRRNPVVASDSGRTIVVAWETQTGEPIEARVRTGRTWSPIRQISEVDARLPAAAVTPDGSALIAWQGFDGDRAVIRLARHGEDGWSTGRIVSPPGVSAREPQLAVDGSGRATVAWLADAGGLRSTVMVAAEDDAGRMSPPTTVGPPLKNRRLRLSLAVDGTAAMAWQADGPDRGAYVAVRSDGRWSAATRVSPAGHEALEPAVAAGRDGTASAIWVTAHDGARIETTDFAAGTWGPATTLDNGDDRPREIARPGRADTGPAIALLPNGAAAVWSRHSADGAWVRAALRRPGARWSTPIDLSRPGAAAGGATLAQQPGAHAAAGWEEIDAGLLRVRIQDLGTGGAGCVDLAPATGESAGVRLVGGGAATAVYVDLNRGRVLAVETK